MNASAGWTPWSAASKVGDVGLHRAPVLPADRPGAHQPPQVQGAAFRRLEVGEVGAVAKNPWPHTLACDDTRQTVFDIVGESRFALLPSLTTSTPASICWRTDSATAVRTRPAKAAWS